MLPGQIVTSATSGSDARGRDYVSVGSNLTLTSDLHLTFFNGSIDNSYYYAEVIGYSNQLRLKGLC